jgi:hypothetical protein
MKGNTLELGTALGTSKPLYLSPQARARHTYVCGGTGVGKSKFLEHCIRQDIIANSESKCGLLLLDPHGLVYENTLAWLERSGLKRKVIPIDLRRDDWIISYNLLRQRPKADPAVIVSGFVRALAHVWGEAGTDKTPLFARWAGIILLTLYQNQYTVSDVMQLLSRDDVRRAMVARLSDPAAQYAWQMAEERPKEFEHQILSTLNRFQRLSGPQVMKATFGQPDVSLNLQEAMEEGQIILVNLATKGAKIDHEDADTFATLLLTDLWSTASDIGKGEAEHVKPFYVYVDECQKFITPTIADNLDEARGFGLHLTLANQYPKRLRNSGLSGQMMYDSIITNAGNKIVFRLEHPEDTKDLALWLFMNSLDTEQVKHVLHATKVMEYRKEEMVSTTQGSSTSQGTGRSEGSGSFHGISSGEGMAGTEDEAAAIWNSYTADSSGEASSSSESEFSSTSSSTSKTTSTQLVPVLGKEISSVQFRSIDEQLFQAMQKLFSQQDRHFAVRYHNGPSAPTFVKTPTVSPVAVNPKIVEKYRHRLLKKLPFALPMVEASARLDTRKTKLLTELIDVQAINEPKSAKGKAIVAKRKTNPSTPL